MLTPFFVFLIGICVGSFLNVLVFRTYENRGLIKGRSKCQSCEIAISWYDLVPVLSFVLLRRRCRSCKSVLSWQYPVIELATGLLLTGLFMVNGFSILFLRDAIFTIFLIILFVYDLRYHLLLDRFTIPAMIVALLLNLFIGVPVWSMFVGAIVLGGFFLGQYWLSKGQWIGDGDIRMGVVMGLMLGLRDGLVALFLAYVIGAAIGVLLLLTKKAKFKTQIPFGTFLAGATLVSLLFGGQIVSWYLALF